MIARKELVEKMMFAFDTERMSLTGTFDSKQRQQCFSAALSVAIEELLKPVTNKEFSDAEHDPNWRPTSRGMDTYNHCLELRKLERVKTPEERVTRKYHPMHKCSVWLDGKMVCEFDSEIHANRYADGLISELAAELPKNQ